jgi:hypothetical protein
VERVTISCPNGHTIRTTVRGRGTTCRQCKAVVYVRLDGTARHARPEPRTESKPRGGPEWGTRRGWGGRRDDHPDVEYARYDPVVSRTALWDESGDYLGYVTGDPYGVVDEESQS